MGRKRLLTLLAALTAAVTLQVGPVAAADDCLVLGEDVTLLELSSLDPAICVVDSSGKLIQGTIDDTTETTDDATETVTDTKKTAEKTAEKVTGGETPEPTEPPATSEPAPSAGGGTGGTAPEDGSAPSGDRSASPRDVTASGEARAPITSDPARDRQLAALRAIRADLAASSPSERGMAGPVQPFGGLSSTDLDLAAPEVADPGVDERLTPQVADADEQGAVLATSSPMRDLAEAPLALKLLATALVLGAGAVWTIASRELGTGTPTTM